MTFWVLQNNLYSEEGFEGLLAALDRFGFPYSIHRCVPFVGTLEPDAFPPDGPVIVMGSYTLANHAAARGWLPGAWLENLDFRTHVKFWGDRMLNADSIVCAFKDASLTEPRFVRPVLDTKSFTGQVMSGEELRAWQERLANLTPEESAAATLNGNTEVMVSSIKEIYSERERGSCVARRHRIRLQGRFDQAVLTAEQVDARITEFARECAAMWSPNDAFVLDVADTAEGLDISRSTTSTRPASTRRTCRSSCSR